jgi:hypothetical protein
MPAQAGIQYLDYPGLRPSPERRIQSKAVFLLMDSRLKELLKLGKLLLHLLQRR